MKNAVRYVDSNDQNVVTQCIRLYRGLAEQMSVAGLQSPVRHVRIRAVVLSLEFTTTHAPQIERLMSSDIYQSLHHCQLYEPSTSTKAMSIYYIPHQRKCPFIAV